jgi:hypothetical protein
METSAETFEIFTSNIYEHKARAIIRELSCNAHDSHVDAGKRDTPFRIHFPTVFEPWFEVEDFGVGLDDYDIRGEEKVLYDADRNEVSRYMEGGIYTTYFASSKRESNESIGHLGLGSKSPMAYTKSMTVVARKDGVERHYVCFIGEGGQPQTTFNSEHETEKANGVSVRFSVPSDDFEEFRREAQFVLSLLRVKPESNITIEPFLSEQECSELRDEGTLIIKNTHPFVQHETAAVYANMGGVVYPVRNIDFYFLGKTVLVNEDAYNTGEEDTPIYHTFDKATVSFIKNVTERSSRCIIVNFAIGDLSFMPSREGLSQDTTTKLNLYKTLVGSFHTKVVELNSKIEACRSPLEAVNKFGEFSSPTDMFAMEYKYKGQSISQIAYNKAFRDIRDLLDHEEADKIIFHYKDYVGRNKFTRSANHTCVRREHLFRKTIYDLYEIMKEKNQASFDCFYCNDKGDYKNLSKAIRFYINQKEVNGERVMFFCTPVESEVFKKVRDVLYGNVRYRHISELVEEVKVIEPTFFDKKARVVSGGRKVSKKNETKSKLIRWDNKKDSYISTDKQVLVKLDKLNHTNCAWVDYSHKGSTSSEYYSIEVGGSVKTISRLRLESILEDFNIKVVLIANKKNDAKIARSGLSHISDMIKSVFDAHYDTILKNRVYENLHTLYKIDEKDIFNRFIRSEYGTEKKILSYLYKSDTEYSQPMIDFVIDKVKRFKIANEYEENFFDSLSSFVNAKEVDKLVIANRSFHDDIIDEMEHITNSIKSRYPLLFGVDEDESLVLEYVEMINERSNKQIKVA